MSYVTIYYMFLFFVSLYKLPFDVYAYTFDICSNKVNLLTYLLMSFRCEDIPLTAYEICTCSSASHKNNRLVYLWFCSVVKVVSKKWGAPFPFPCRPVSSLSSSPSTPSAPFSVPSPPLRSRTPYCS